MKNDFEQVLEQLENINSTINELESSDKWDNITTSIMVVAVVVAIIMVVPSCIKEDFLNHRIDKQIELKKQEILLQKEMKNEK